MRNILNTTAACLVVCAVPAAHAAVIGTMQPAEAVTEARLAGVADLAPQEREAWLAYLARSREQMAADKAALAAERAGAIALAGTRAEAEPVPAAPPHAQGGDGGMPLRRPAAWYGTPEARRVAANIVSFQTPAGGWGKNVDRTGPARLRGQSYVADAGWSYVGTIDNNATTSELRFLARVQAQASGAPGDGYRAAILKGMRYLLNAQYPNGGYPQVYPLAGGYHDAITFNDNAMAAVVELLADVGGGQGDYAFVPGAVAGEVRAAAGKAIRLILSTQVVAGGVRTGWCQQHDALTLAPAGARNFEPVSLTSAESAHLLMLLMRQPAPEPEAVAAVHAGAAWLERSALRGMEWSAATPQAGRQLKAGPGAGPLWSRLYDIPTMKPIFGDRDRSIHDDVNDLSAERRNGYAWYGTGPAAALALYASWSRSHPMPASP
ncbi:pectate lyase [Pseudoduganella sp. LjRoot289]|uniref:pectate lyase n=1 Tax=Pseudoduganella sp. LjRoot289 TaxID=3342314 RepID=UPI003ED0B850